MLGEQQESKPLVRCRRDVLKTYEIQVGSDWATIAIRGMKSGRVIIDSCFGSWGYYWGNPGDQGIHRFLIGADANYLMKKFAGGARVCDVESTLKAWRVCVTGCRRLGGLTEEQARDAFDEIEQLNGARTDTDLYYTFRDSEVLALVWPDGDIPVYYEQPRELQAFMRQIWPHFVEMLRAECTGKWRLA